VLLGILYLACEVYLDDILIYGTTEDEYFDNLEQVLKDYISKHRLTVNPDKTLLSVDEYIGHYITNEGISHTRERIEKVLDNPKPTSTKQLKCFIRVVEYFHAHVRDFSILLLPLRKHLDNYNKHKPKAITWTE